MLHKIGSEGTSPEKNKNVPSPLPSTTPTEAEIDGELSELKETLNKIRETSIELEKLFAEGPLSSRPTGKLLTNTVEQHLARALKSQRSIELLRIVKNLTYRESATQVTPVRTAITERTTDTEIKTVGKRKNKQISVINKNIDRANRTPANPRAENQGDWVEVNQKKRKEEKK